MGARDEPLSLESVLADVSKELGRIKDQTRDLGETALAEAKAGRDIAKSAKEKIDELLTEGGQLAQYQARLQELEQKMARRGEEEKQKPQTAGQMLVAAESFKNWLDGGGRKRQSGF